MKGYRDKNGDFHIVLERKEGQDLSVLINEGAKRIKEEWKTDTKGKPLELYEECVIEAQIFCDKISILYLADNYRKLPATEKNPIIARITEPLRIKESMQKQEKT